MHGKPIRLALLFSLLALGARGAEPDLTITDNAPILRAWTPPAYPAELLKEKVEGTVSVRFIVDATGHVTTARVLESPDPRLNAAALAAVKSWGFSDGMEDGKPAAYSLDVPIVFSIDRARKKTKPDLLPPMPEMPQPSPRTEVETKSSPPGDYPPVLTERKIPGAVTFACVVSAEGRALSPQITGATHVEFVLPALEALKHWEFTTAMQGDLPSKSTLEGKVTFDALGDTVEEILAANALTAPDGSVPAAPPMPYIVADPVWPLELLLKGEGGSATVEFTVESNGIPSGVKVREASRPEFGRALAAALEAWTFHPAMSSGGTVATPLIKRTEFKAVPVGKESAADPVERLVAALRANTVGPATKLDARLTPICRVSPMYPAAYPESDRPAGKAEIEFVIDRDGRARLPRIVSASREEFGWAAATAVQQWVFLPPRRGGQPVDVKIKIPFEFAAPAQ